MANNQEVDMEKIVRDQYETKLYDFTVDQFMQEHFALVESLIEKEVKKYTMNAAKLVTDPSPEFDMKMQAASKAVMKEIFTSCLPEIEKINEFIEKEFRIPDNVLLPEDQLLYDKEHTAEEEEALREECDVLEKNVMENAFFIHALEAEQKSYQKVEPVFEQQNQIIKQTAEHMNTVEVDILKNALRKIKLANVDPQGTP